jgi:hypothetical protein
MMHCLLLVRGLACLCFYVSPIVPSPDVAPRNILLSKKTFHLVILSLLFVVYAINHYIISQAIQDLQSETVRFLTFHNVSDRLK